MLKRVCLSMTLALAAAHAFAENIPYDQAKEAGVVKCLPMIRKVAQFLHEEKNHGAHSTWARSAPDKQMFTSTIERTYSDGAEIASIFAAPAVDGGCAVAYERVSVFEKSCLALSRDTFADFEYGGTVNKFVTVLTKKGGGGSAYLMSADTGCIAIRKETMLDGSAR